MQPTESADHIIRCECGGDHFVTVRYWKDEEWPSGYFSLCSEYVAERYSFLGRLKIAAKVLWRGACTLDEVMLDRAGAARLIEAVRPVAEA
jgi:hypothetical protein